MSANHSIKDWVKLSSYLDGELNDREKNKLEQLLRANPDLQNELEQLRQTRAMLRTMPRKKAPRNFTLSPEMAAARKPRFWVPLFSLSSAASAVVALVLLFIQLLPGFFAGAQPGMLAKDTQMEMTAPMAASEAEGEPDIIYWDGPQDQLQVEGKGGGGLTEEQAPMQMVAPPVEKEGVQPEEEIAEAAPQEAVEEEAVAEESITEEPAAEESMPEAMEIEIVEESEQDIPSTTNLEEELTDESPILGIRPTDELGQITVPTPITIEAEDLPFPFWLLEIIFLSLAVAFGFIAFVLWRRTR